MASIGSGKTFVLSVRPVYVQRLLSGEKTVELRQATVSQTVRQLHSTPLFDFTRPSNRWQGRIGKGFPPLIAVALEIFLRRHRRDSPGV